MNTEEDIKILRERSHKTSNELASLKGRMEVKEMKDEKSNAWTLWTAGVIATIIMAVVSLIGTSVIANDKESRDRDSEVGKRLEIMCENQNKVNQEILVSLSSIKTELVYIKKAIEK